MSFDLPPHILFRPAHPRDIKGIEIIENESFADGVRESPDVFEGRIKAFRDGFLVAEDVDTGALGAYICSELQDGTAPVNAETLKIGHLPDGAHKSGGDRLYISSFAVKTAWRGHKIGAALFQALEKRILDRCPAVRTALLVVSEKQTRARELYEKNGYAETTRLPAFFTPAGEPAEDGVAMVKTLKA